MKYIYKMVLLLLLIFSLVGCKNLLSQETNSSFDESQKILIKDKAKEFTNEQYQQGEVPLKTYIKIKGKAIESDSKSNEIIKKNDRFIIENNGYKYQIINHSDEELKMYDNVIVYGEYYGFIKAILII